MSKTPREPVTQELLDKIDAEQARTGLGITKLMRGKRETLPEGLTSATVWSWKARSAKTARCDHVQWVLDAYGAYEPPPPPVPARIKITDEMRAAICAEYDRTKLGAHNILRLAPQPLPEGLNKMKVQNWIHGKTRSCKAEHWDFVMAVYASVQSRKST